MDSSSFVVVFGRLFEVVPFFVVDDFNTSVVVLAIVVVLGGLFVVDPSFVVDVVFGGLFVVAGRAG